MKVKGLLLLLLSALLSACQSHPPSTASNSAAQPVTASEQPPNPGNIGEGADSSDNERLSMNVGNYELKGEFYEEMHRNPIDQDYEREFDAFQNTTKIMTTLEWGALESKYAEIWDKELNQIYKKLLAKLDRESRKALMESQKQWLQYHLKETKFVEDTFIYNGYLGSQGVVSQSRVTKERIRERTMQLFEYRYLLDRKVEYLYSSKK
ncbi:lysozyme inhibitor LprI family protein [Saccharibacillus qingshengii]|uniref:lysozyme inhibitor LprI family protein n=1 Tax=Saccharibacillus qingshengii TaxID=1763540 RepID=UPI00155569C4|nr:lysozyme inhibitor LprI family protein [Saccharibacillus qingshengii]